ncbi:MAG: histidine kinase [Gemmatimonadaceae bacterium]|nr:histidine kinase [Gemmatimonadaceae bacterium]
MIRALMLLLLLLVAAMPVKAQDASGLEPFAFVVRTVQVCRTAATDPTPQRPSAACRSVPTSDVNPQGTALWMFGEVIIPSMVERSRVPMAVLMQGMASTAIYWDGHLIGASGVVSTSAAGEVPGRFVHVVPLRADELRPGVHRIAVHLSSHRGPFRVQTPVHVLLIAPLDAIRDGIGGGTAPTLVALGALVLASLYFAAVASGVAPRGDAALVAALIACALLQGGAELWRAMLPISYVEQIWRLLVILLAATALGACLVAYCTRRFQRARQGRYLITYGVLALLAWTLLPGFDERTFVVLGVACITALAAIAPSARRGVPGSRAIALVLAGLCLAAPMTPGLFLDRDVFLGVAVLAMFLMMDQVAEVRRVQRSAAEARQAVERLELELLRRRLTPHWLLNMLNALTAWIDEEPTTAVRMVSLLGDEFRRLADPVDAPLIPLRDELAACRRLLELMSLRSGRTFTLDDSGIAPALQVPPGVLHTLVENALTHGCYRRGATFIVRQVDELCGPTLAFDAPAADPADARRVLASGRESGSDGFGLSYVRARLTAAFGASGRLTHGPRVDGGWRTVLRLGGASL